MVMEVYTMSATRLYSPVSFALVSHPSRHRLTSLRAGSTDACLRQNPGQLATASMAALASSLSSASPQLFTYAS